MARCGSQACAGAKALRGADVRMVTTCQANAAILPRLKDDGTTLLFLASGNAVVTAGLTLPQARGHVVAGKFGSPRVTLEIAPPRGEKAVGVYAAAHVQSSNPPRADIRYQIEYSLDAGKTWQPIVKDWTISRRGDEPKDFWSQSFCYGHRTLDGAQPKSVQVRFHNTGGKNYARGEVHLIYRAAHPDSTRVTVAWRDDKGMQQASRTFAPTAKETPWRLATGRGVQTRWIEFEPTPAR